MQHLTGTRNTLEARRRRRRRGSVRKVTLDFSVLAPVDEELFRGNTEAPTDVDDAAKEEALECEIRVEK